MAKRQRVGGRSAGRDFALGQPFDPAQWIHVDAAALPKNRREQFLKRKRAIELYADGATDAMLRQETGLKRRNVYRLIADRCLQQADDGTMLGWRGALPFLRIKAYTRHAAPKVDRWGDGAVGALQWVFSWFCRINFFQH